MMSKTKKVMARTNKGEQTMNSKIIIALLDNHKMSFTALSQEVDYPKENLSGYLQWLKKDKLVMNAGYGVYTLTELGKKAAGFLLQDKNFEFVKGGGEVEQEPIINPNDKEDQWQPGKPILNVPDKSGDRVPNPIDKEMWKEQSPVEQVANRVPIHYEREVLDLLKEAIKVLGARNER